MLQRPRLATLCLMTLVGLGTAGVLVALAAGWRIAWLQAQPQAGLTGFDGVGWEIAFCSIWLIGAILVALPCWMLGDRGGVVAWKPRASPLSLRSDSVARADRMGVLNG